jgi:adenine-specific DNA-methyltransferase
LKKQNTDFAKELRRNQTNAEAVLWNRLRSSQVNGVKFRRQQPIKNYIVDFVTFEKRLIVELDGSQHDEASMKEKDTKRTAFLESQGFRVIRFWDNDVLSNIDGVLEKIAEVLKL